MVTKLAPRRIQSGPYFPSAPRTGNEGDEVIFRKQGLITRGQGARLYEEVYHGVGELNPAEPISRGALTGAVLTLTANSNIVVGGIGSRFRLECNLGQRILVEGATTSWLIIPKRIIDDSHMEVWKAPTSNGSGTGYRLPRIYAVDSQRGTSWWGNVLKLDQGSLVGVGDGPFLLDGKPIPTLPGDELVLKRQSQLALLNPVTGIYDVMPLGMPAPAPFTLANVGQTGGGKKAMAIGSYGIVLTPLHAETGGYNNPSVVVVIELSAVGNQVVITPPPLHVPSGQTGWGMWVTPYSFSLSSDLNFKNGPFSFWQNITPADLVGGVYTTEWLDSEVEFNERLDFNNDPPPDANFVELLDYKLVYVSCYGPGDNSLPASPNPDSKITTAPGPFIVPTKPNNIDAAPAEFAQSSSPPETILGVVSAQGRLYLLTTNHLQIAMSTGRDDVPVVIRPYWKDGFAGPEQVVFVNGMLYGFTVSGPSRSTGEGDESFVQHDWAADVEEIMRDWNPGQVLVGFDPTNDMVLFFHSADHLNHPEKPANQRFWTTRVLGYGLAQNNWIFDDILTSDTEDMIVCGVATVGQHLEVLTGGRGVAGAKTRRFDYFGTEVGKTVPWYVIPQISDSGEELRAKVVKAVRVTGKVGAGSNVKLYGWGPTETVDVDELVAGTLSNTGPIALDPTLVVEQSQRFPLNLPNAVLHTVRVSGSWDGSGMQDRIDEIVYEVAIHGARI